MASLPSTPRTTRPSWPATRSSRWAIASNWVLPMRWRCPDSWSGIGAACVGAVLGGLAGGFVAVAMTLVLKAGIDFASTRGVLYALVVPVLGLVLATLVLHGLGRRATSSASGARAPGWRTFPPDAIRADISGDVVDTAGEEERFP